MIKILHVMVEDPKFPIWFFDFLYKNGFFREEAVHHTFLCKANGFFDAHVKKTAAIEIGHSFRMEYFPAHPRLLGIFSSALHISRLADSYDKVVFHWLSDGPLLSLLSPRVAKRSFWILWGGDLYGFRTNRSRGARDYLSECLRICFIPRLKGICGLLHGDFELASKWYGAKAEWHQVFYPFPIPSIAPKNKKTKEKRQKLTVQVGNSADLANNHIEILETLSKIDFVEKVICPLSYGDADYAEQVAKAGKLLLGDRFHALTTFMAADDYTALLSTVDIAIMNHKRQQGVGNIIINLLAGNKVFLRESVTTFGFLNDIAATVFATERFLSEPESSLKAALQVDSQKTAGAVQSFFSDEKCKKLWQDLFSA